LCGGRRRLGKISHEEWDVRVKLDVLPLEPVLVLSHVGCLRNACLAFIINVGNKGQSCPESDNSSSGVGIHHDHAFDMYCMNTCSSPSISVAGEIYLGSQTFNFLGTLMS